MKISSIGVIRNTSPVAANKISSNYNMSAPIKFGNSQDIFDFSDIDGVSHLEIDTENIPQNISMQGYNYFLYDQFAGSIGDALLTMKFQSRKWDGIYDGKIFEIKSKRSSSPQFNIRGEIGKKRFETKAATIDEKSFITGWYDKQSIKLRAFDCCNFSHVKGTIGSEPVEFRIEKLEEGKETRGRIGDTEFIFLQKKDSIQGGITQDNELLPIIIAITDRTDNRNFTNGRTENNYDYVCDPRVD